MVAGTGYDACRQDRRHTLAVGPAGRAGNSKSVRRSPGLLADLTVRQFWSVRAAQRYFSGHADTMRTSCSRCRWNDPRTGAGLWRADPYLTATDAPGRRGVGSPINRRRIAVRRLVLRREFCPIHLPTAVSAYTRDAEALDRIFVEV